MIELRDVSIRIGDCQLNDISLKVETGQYAVLMGRTGLGKTTLLEAICGLRRVTRGRILVQDQDVTDWAPGDRMIGYVPQDLALFPSMTVAQHLGFALRFRKRSASEISTTVHQVAAELGIAHLLSRGVRNLSGGESQRVALGRAIAFQPTLLLLDEPLSALDEQTREAMHQVLRNIKERRQVTTIHVTHNSEEAAALADSYLNLDQCVPSHVSATKPKTFG